MKHRHLLAAILSSFAIIGSSAVYAQENYTLDPDHSYVGWKISHFGFSQPSGKWFANGNVTIDEDNPQNSKVNITIKVADMVTGIPKLDDHLRSKDFFDTNKYPLATFVSNTVTLTANNSANVQGMLTIHGITRPVTLHVKLNKHDISPLTDKMTAGFTASTEIKRSEFGITTYLPGLGDEVKLAIEVEAIRNA